MQPETRRCSAIQCKEIIKRTLLMCPAHWSQLPAELQASVHTTLRAWNSGSSARAYLIAVNKAQLVIAEKEGLPYASSIRENIAKLEASTESMRSAQ